MSDDVHLYHPENPMATCSHGVPALSAAQRLPLSRRVSGSGHVYPR